MLTQAPPPLFFLYRRAFIYFLFYFLASHPPRSLRSGYGGEVFSFAESQTWLNLPGQETPLSTRTVTDRIRLYGVWSFVLFCFCPLCSTPLQFAYTTNHSRWDSERSHFVDVDICGRDAPCVSEKRKTNAIGDESLVASPWRSFVGCLHRRYWNSVTSSSQLELHRIAVFKGR